MMSDTPIGQAVVEELAEALEEVEPKSTPGKRYRKAQRQVNTMSMDDILDVLLNADRRVFCRALEAEDQANEKQYAQIMAAISARDWSKVCQLAAS
jgi:hypothetical protein